MTAGARRARSALTRLAAVIGLLAAVSAPASAQETVAVSVPVAVDFLVTDVTASTPASSSAVVTLSSINVLTGHRVRVSLKADAAAFTPPSGTGTIAADKLHWTIGAMSNGAGWSGQMSSSSFTNLFETNAAVSSASVTLSFSLAAPGTGIRSGTHTLTGTWKFESITP